MAVQDIIPSSKDDFAALHRLSATADPQIIRDNAHELLEWLQDLNWPITSELARILSPYLNILENEICRILQGIDQEWKYSIISSELLPEELNNLPGKIKAEITRIHETPSTKEVEHNIHEMVTETYFDSTPN